ncbi:hypothetical protein GCK32_003918 [Trichostrongylus colubriformis]|uniref:Uncharacterized protein n=1 Tax=Trichostrongylus colubriformis TaxID=6319 RepID=A0AAN8FA10_TRICO
MRRRSCVLCGRTVVANDIKRTVDRASTDEVMEVISNPNKFICQSHIVQAAQYLSGEMAATGRKFSYYDYPSARGKIAYVHTLDIPPHLVDVINGMSKSNVTATARDVLSFMNSALKKYYGTSAWPYQYNEEVLRNSSTNDGAGESAARLEDDAVKQSAEDDAEMDEDGSGSSDEASSSLGKVFGYEPDPATLRRKRTHRGNVMTLVSTVANGLRYLELARWAKQTNLSIFSRTFFWKFLEEIKLYNSL